MKTFRSWLARGWRRHKNRLVQSQRRQPSNSSYLLTPHPFLATLLGGGVISGVGAVLHNLNKRTAALAEVSAQLIFRYTHTYTGLPDLERIGDEDHIGTTPITPSLLISCSWFRCGST